MTSISELRIKYPYEVEIPDGCLAGLAGFFTGAVAGAGYLGYQGYQLGEWITNNYQITDHYLKNLIDISSSITGGIVGAPTGALAGMFAGISLGHFLGKVKNSKLINLK